MSATLDSIAHSPLCDHLSLFREDHDAKSASPELSRSSHNPMQIRMLQPDRCKIK